MGVSPEDELRERTTMRSDSTGSSTGGPAGEPPATVERIGRYRIEGELGRGGMGVVYRAFDEELRRTVAIKMILDPARAGASELERFRREASAAARLAHPGIVGVHEVGVHDGKPYIVMELVEGESFEHLLRREKPTPRRTAEILRDVAAALDAAHAAGIVHRDVKPENILIDREGRPRLMDFGLARDVSGDRVTVTGTILGTPVYMSPEQASGAVAAHGPLTDVWSVGAVLYRGLVGTPPFTAPTVAVILSRIMSDEPVPPRKRNPAIHGDLETICLRCLEKTPRARYASAGEVARELGRYVAGEPIAARPIGGLERALRFVRRNRLATALVLVLLAAPVTGLVLVAKARQSQSDQFLAAARADAERTHAAFAATRRPPGATPDRKAGDEALGRGLEALDAAPRLAALEGGEGSRAAARDVALEAGEVAIGVEQWSVAASIFERAGKLGLPETRLAELRARVETERTRVQEDHKKTVEGLLDDARSGRLETRPDGRREAVIALVRYPEKQTVEILARTLDDASASLRATTREIVHALIDPTPEEARRDEVPLTGAEKALDDDHVDPADGPGRALHEAWHRLERRDQRAHPGRKLDLPWWQIVAAEQARRAGDKIPAARLACEALGLLAISEGAVPALERWLRSVVDETLATEAAISLLRLRGAAAVRLIDRRDAEVWGAHHTSGIGGGDAFSRQVHLLVESLRLPEAQATTADEHVDRAVGEARRGDLDGAIADLTSALALGGDSAGILDRRGVVKKARGDFAGAIADLTSAIELEPQSADPIQHRGEAKLAQGDRRGAFDDLLRAASLAPGTAKAWRNLSRAKALRGDVKGAIACMTSAIEIEPADTILLHERAIMRMNALDPAGAIEDETSAIAIAPQDGLLFSFRGLARQKQGDLKGALEDHDRAVALRPREALVYANRAEAYVAAGDGDAALRDLARTIELAPRYAPAFASRARILFDRGDLAGALAEAEHALALDRRNGIALSIRGSVRARRGDLERGLADHALAIQLDPRDERRWFWRAATRADTGDPTGAISDYTKGLALDPRNKEGLTNRGSCYEALDDLDHAIEDHTKALEIDPGYVGALVNRGVAYSRKKDYAGASKDLTRAIELAPREPNAYFNRATVRIFQNDLDGALADLTKVVELQPNEAQHYYRRGRVRLEKGQREGGLADLERFIELAAPNQPGLEEAKKVVAELKAPKKP
jgi:tetratricopeptide (TPR) repeat protein/predicted Ser/Thr protein kinase